MGGAGCKLMRSLQMVRRVYMLSYVVLTNTDCKLSRTYTRGGAMS